MRSFTPAIGVLSCILACDSFPAGKNPCDGNETGLPAGAACCPERAHACAPGFACASGADGSGPECRAEGGAACTDGVDCASGACHREALACRSRPGTACTPGVGCARGPEGAPYACGDTGLCVPAGTGWPGNDCADGADCRSLRCEDGVCAGYCDLGSGSGPCAGDEFSACDACFQRALAVEPSAPVDCWSGDCFNTRLSCMATFCPAALCEWWARVLAIAPETPACL